MSCHSIFQSSKPWGDSWEAVDESLPVNWYNVSIIWSIRRQVAGVAELLDQHQLTAFFSDLLCDIDAREREGRRNFVAKMLLMKTKLSNMKEITVELLREHCFLVAFHKDPYLNNLFNDVIDCKIFICFWLHYLWIFSHWLHNNVLENFKLSND